MASLPARTLPFPPEWGWLITLYFFSVAWPADAYFLAALIDFFGQPEDRPLARLGYYISFPCIIMSGFLLVIDLHRPLRFWHMLIESNTFQPMFKYWSPMSVGSWALLIFGIFFFSLLSRSVSGRSTVRWSAAGAVRPPGAIAKVIAMVGGLCGFTSPVTRECFWLSPIVRSGLTHRCWGCFLLYRPHRHRRH